MMGEPLIADIQKEKNLENKAVRFSTYGSWKKLSLPRSPSSLIGINLTESPPFTIPVFHSANCSSTMDLAWHLNNLNEFPTGSSVLADHQHNGRGQFKRQWVSNPGNLYASIRIPDSPAHSSTAPLISALAINRSLQHLGIFSEYKWPNDILVNGKKIGGILVEDRSGIAIVGIGLNLVHSPSMEDMRNPYGLPAGHLAESGLSMSPTEIWPIIADIIMEYSDFFSGGKNLEEIIKPLERIMAFKGESIVFKPLDGNEFPAVLSGLSENGGIRLKTTDGEKIFLSGSFTPVIH